MAIPRSRKKKNKRPDVSYGLQHRLMESNQIVMGTLVADAHIYLKYDEDQMKRLVNAFISNMNTTIDKFAGSGWSPIMLAKHTDINFLARCTAMDETRAECYRLTVGIAIMTMLDMGWSRERINFMVNQVFVVQKECGNDGHKWFIGNVKKYTGYDIDMHCVW